jgi:hypothetical protein
MDYYTSYSRTSKFILKMDTVCFSEWTRQDHIPEDEMITRNLLVVKAQLVAD